LTPFILYSYCGLFPVGSEIICRFRSVFKSGFFNYHYIALNLYRLQKQVCNFL
jgi:hypothetical protein